MDDLQWTFRSFFRDRRTLTRVFAFASGMPLRDWTNSDQHRSLAIRVHGGRLFDVGILTTDDLLSKTVALVISEDKNADTLRSLLRAGLDVSRRDMREAVCNWQPLHLACWVPHRGCASALIEYGADPAAVANGDFFGETPAELARMQNDGQLAVALEICQRDRDGGMKALRVLAAMEEVRKAAEEDDVETMRAIFEREPAIRIAHHPGWRSPRNTHVLFDMVRINRSGPLRVLLECGLEPDVRDLAGRTPLYEACRAGLVRCALALVEHGANAALEGDGGGLSEDGVCTGRPQLREALGMCCDAEPERRAAGLAMLRDLAAAEAEEERERDVREREAWERAESSRRCRLERVGR